MEAQLRLAIKHSSYARLEEAYPFIAGWFEAQDLGLDLNDPRPVAALLESLPASVLEEKAVDVHMLLEDLLLYLSETCAFMGLGNDTVRSLTILPGQDKSGRPEAFDSLVLHASEVISIVGPTGSGKSRLLADIEWLAQGDTPTKRSILVDGKKPDLSWRYTPQNRLVAQLSQNMNFVMDVSVQDFLALHAQSRMVMRQEAVIEEILEAANFLAGEQFAPETPVTSLSGGQSRALMIADTALLSRSPIVLIDEIENAGIDRQRALDLLMAQDKIILLATHDPSLALMADRRLVIRHGGIAQILERDEKETALLQELAAIDAKLAAWRESLRSGQRLRESAKALPSGI